MKICFLNATIIKSVLIILSVLIHQIKFKPLYINPCNIFNIVGTILKLLNISGD